MMPSTVAEMAAGRSVAVTRLFEFAFTSSTQRFWDGLGYLDTTDARRWQGAGKLIGVSGLEYAENLAAQPATFSLSGATPELVAAAIDGETEVKNRPVRVYLQFLTSRYVPLDAPIAIWAGRMDVLTFSGTATQQNLSLSAETLFVDRIRAPYGLQTDTDQQARYPGDLGMVFMPELKNKTTNWLRG